jgi:hypothetical protein
LGLHLHHWSLQLWLRLGLGLSLGLCLGFQQTHNFLILGYEIL